MDSADLKERQAPVRERYRLDPSAALVTLTASGVLGAENVSCSVDVGRQLIKAGLHEATGGDGVMASSGDMLLEALVACAGVTLRAVAINRGLDVTGTVTAEGLLDFRGTMAIDRDAPVGFLSVDLRFELETDATPEEITTLIRTTERYSVVYQTLRAGTPVMVTTTVS